MVAASRVGARREMGIMGGRSYLAKIGLVCAAICLAAPASASEVLVTRFDLSTSPMFNPISPATNAVASVTFYSDPIDGGFDLDLEVGGPPLPGLVDADPNPTVAMGRYDAAVNGATQGGRSGATTPSAVPEPASWAMMILGLGLIGVALRGFHVLDRRLESLRDPLD